MEGSVKDLSDIRYERAEEMLVAAKKNYEQDELKTALNRSYYAIFHAMRSVNCLDGYDSSKHSGVISHFNQSILKTGKMDPIFSDTIKKASYCREKSDYDDFYVVSRKEAKEQIEKAEEFLKAVREYIDQRIKL
ncbi:MAG TPA: antitoxin [Lachnospiraceae bacterium]|nr:antitoxin [Lachnospiraceae bacterium]